VLDLLLWLGAIKKSMNHPHSCAAQGKQVRFSGKHYEHNTAYYRINNKYNTMPSTIVGSHTKIHVN